MKANRRHRYVEIYFILYLAALVLLLPDKRDAKNNDNNNSATAIDAGFSLICERGALFCKLKVDSLGLEVLSLDSTNTIYWTGEVKDVKFEFIVEDQTLRQNLTLNVENKPSTKYFQIKENRETHSASFNWIPPALERNNKTYVVRVIATATPKESNETVSNNIRLTARAQFSLNIVPVDRKTGQPLVPIDFAAQNALSAGDLTQSGTQISNGNFQYSGKMNLILEKNMISSIAWQNWTNTIYTSNVDIVRDLDGMPIVRAVCDPVGNGGEASLLDLLDDRLTIRGKTPSYGTMRVEVRVRRRSDGEEFTANFAVKPVPIEQPKIPRELYPGKLYTFDPKMPMIGQSSRALLKYGEQLLAAGNQGEKFTYMADISDTGKILNFERYVDDNLYGQIYYCRIASYPDPVIIDVQRSSFNEVTIVTLSYGFYNQDPNEIINFYIEGNAKFQDMRGKMKDESDGSARRQYFRFIPKNAANPFEFTCYGVDRRGKITARRSFKE